MADPNFAAVAETLAFAADVLDELESYTSTASTGLVATLEALRNDVEGDWAQDARAGILAAAQSVNNPLTKAGARRIFDPILRQMAVAISYQAPNGSIEDIWEALYDYCVTNSQSINDSEDTIDTSYSAGGSNVGDGTISVLTLDENGETLGGWLTDAWTLECVRDAREIGQVHQEQWRLTGTDARPDNLDFTGTGLRVDGIRTTAADLSKTYVKNPSFNSYTLDGSSNLTALPGWTQNDGANLYTNLSIDTAKAFRTTPGESTSVSLQFDSDETIYQDLVATAGARIDLNRPFLIDVAVHREGSATGNVTLRLSGTIGSGGKSATVALSSITADTWSRLRIAVNADCWPKNWNANDLKLQIKVDTLAVSTCLVDDIVFTPLTRVGRYGDPRSGRGSMGIYLCVHGGATPFVKDDVFTATDTLGTTRGVNHWALSKIAQYGYLPLQTGGTETIADK